MGERFTFVSFEEVDLAGALLVVAMPGVGLEGPVAASLLTSELEMRMVGAIQGDDLPPAAAVRGGIVTSPIQLWAAELACGADGKCDRLVVLKSDIAIEPEVMAPLAGELAIWARRTGISLVIGLDSYAPENGREDGILMAASIKARDLRGHVAATPIEEALLTGFTAILLVRANREGIPAVGLFAPAPEEEGLAADGTARLLDVAAPLIPKLALSPTDLAQRAQQTAIALRLEREQQAAEARRMRESVDRGYV